MKRAKKLGIVLVSAVIVTAFLVVAMGTYLAGNAIVESASLDPFSDSDQYHWDHMPITYNSDSCQGVFDGRMSEDIENALGFIEQRTNNSIRFEKTSENADITYVCDIGGIRTSEGGDGYYTYAKSIPRIYEGSNIYAPGQITIYSSYDCLGKRPTLVIHETLHMFGLDHNVNPSYTGDIMHPFLSSSCNADIIQSDMDYLLDIYG